MVEFSNLNCEGCLLPNPVDLVIRRFSITDSDAGYPLQITANQLAQQCPGYGLSGRGNLGSVPVDCEGDGPVTVGLVTGEP